MISVIISENQVITDINIPDSVTAIKPEAFSYCTSLKSITIPGRVTAIGSDNGNSSYVFSGCTSLTSVTIPDSVTHLNGGFENCLNIKVNYKGKEYDYDHLERLYSDVNTN